MMQLYGSTPRETPDLENEVEVVSDGVRLRIPAGTVLQLLPGQSVTLTPGLYHAFWAQEGHGPVLLGEVSQCNDDKSDNRFLDDVGRFPEIEEDEAPYRLLCTEYPAAGRDVEASSHD
jgi:D-lyxose ketol-isomerase